MEAAGIEPDSQQIRSTANPTQKPHKTFHANLMRKPNPTNLLGTPTQLLKNRVQLVSTPDILRELVQRWEELSRGDQDEITNLAERKLLDSKTKIDANRPISTQDHLESESTEQ